MLPSYPTDQPWILRDLKITEAYKASKKKVPVELNSSENLLNVYCLILSALVQ